MDVASETTIAHGENLETFFNRKEPKFIKPRETVETRDKILAAAEEIFALKGITGARTEEIGKKAKVNKAMIHYYFGNKKDLYYAVLDKFLLDLVKSVQEVLIKDSNGRPLVEDLVKTFVRYSYKHKYFSKLINQELLNQESKYMEKTISAVIRPIYERAAKYFEQELNKNIMGPLLDPSQFLITIFITLTAYFSESELFKLLAGSDPLTPEAIVRHENLVVEIICRMLNLK